MPRVIFVMNSGQAHNLEDLQSSSHPNLPVRLQHQLYGRRVQYAPAVFHEVVCFERKKRKSSFLGDVKLKKNTIFFVEIDQVTGVDSHGADPWGRSDNPFA